MNKIVTINNQNYNVLFDTGSKYNIMSPDVYVSMQKPKLKSSNFYLIGFGKKKHESKIKPIGHLEVNIEIEAECYCLVFHVVPSDAIDVDVVLGQPFCMQARVEISSSGLKFEKIDKCNEIHRMMLINIDDQNSKLEVDIDGSASQEGKQQLLDLVAKYEPKKCKSTNIEMNIILKDETPIYSRPRRLPIAEKQIVDEQIDQWLEDDIIEATESEFCSPVVLVKKRSGSYRLCVDYRRINKVIVKDRFPLLLIEDLLAQLQHANVFSTIDLKNGFFHVDVAVPSRKYT